MKALVCTILSSFIGIKRAKTAEQEITRLRPIQLIAAAFFCLVSLVTFIFLLVKMVVYLSH